MPTAEAHLRDLLTWPLVWYDEPSDLLHCSACDEFWPRAAAPQHAENCPIPAIREHLREVDGVDRER